MLIIGSQWQFFDVPPQKIHPTDSLRNDLQSTKLEPVFHFFVIRHVLNARNVQSQLFTFKPRELADIGDLATDIQLILDELDNPNLGSNDVR